MATLTLTLGASADDALINDLAYDDTATTMNVGGVGSAPQANYGEGFRFTNVTLAGADTINSAILKLMKSGTQWSTQDNRWTCVDADNTPTFSSGNPPGSRAIVATIVDESNNVNETDGTVYNFPRGSGDQTAFGGAIANVTGRAGWASGNALAVVNNSDQDASAHQTFTRKSFHTWDSSVGSSEPQLVIDYTPSVSVTLEQEGYRWRADDGSESGASWLAAQDTPITRGRDVETRLRMLVDATGDPAAAATKLQFRKVGQTEEAAWRDVIKR